MENGSFEMVNANVCQHCGSVTKIHEEVATQSKMQGIGYPITGWIFAVISLVFLPLLFGIVALAMGFFTYLDRSKTHGVVLMSFATFGLVVGTIFGFFVSGTLFI